MRKTFLLALTALTLSAIVGCANNQQVIGKTLLATQQEIVSTHELFRSPCKTGVVKKETCIKVDEITDKAKPIFDAAVDATVLGIDTGDNTTAQAKAAELATLLADLTTLATQYGLKTATEATK